MASDTQDSLLSASAIGETGLEAGLGSGASTPLRSNGPSPSQSAEDISFKEEDEEEEEEEEASLSDLKDGADAGSIEDQRSLASLDAGTCSCLLLFM